MPEHVVLVLAKEYGRPPGEIEQEWEPFWTNRAIKLLEAEAEMRRREDRQRARARRK